MYFDNMQPPTYSNSAQIHYLFTTLPTMCHLKKMYCPDILIYLVVIAIFFFPLKAIALNKIVQQQISISNSSSVQHRTSCLLFLSTIKFYLAPDCTDLVHPVKTAEFLCITDLLCLENIFSYSHSPPRAFLSFFSFTMIPKPWKDRV